MIETEVKFCKSCGEFKDKTCFLSREGSADRLRYYCRTCGVKKNRKYNLKKFFGITPEDYAEMLTAQKGVCAICSRPSLKKALAVDHDHKTGRVRGLLCEACNRSLGGFGDCSERLRLAAAYLDRAGQNNQDRS